MVNKDSIYSTRMEQVLPFDFDQRVASVFDDMISRSVPSYRTIQELSGKIAARVCTENSSMYDLGCSTGTSLIQVAEAYRGRKLKIIGVDKSEAMLAKCREKITALDLSKSVTIIQADLEDFIPHNASLVLLNYTLQFIPPERRAHIVRTIWKSLVPGGVLILSEKIRHNSEVLNNLITALHHNFKQQNGYSSLEISQKREAIENILIPLTIEENESLLKSAGFQSYELLIKALNFASFIAVKE